MSKIKLNDVNTNTKYTNYGTNTDYTNNVILLNSN